MRFLIFILLIVMSCKAEKTRTSTVNEATVLQKKEELKIDTVVIPNVDKEILLGKFNEKSKDNFVRIPKAYADRVGMYLQKEALDAFIKMHTAASKEGITLNIRSATRNFTYQKGIWERKWTGTTILSSGKNAAKITDEKERALNILEYSSMPGTSRHHWGTDIDLNAFTNKYFESGEGLKIYNWLTANAGTYGFCQPYTSKEHREGYNEEKWHWSFMPLSQNYTRSIREKVSYSDIKGFKGDNTAEEIDVITKYMLGINDQCK